LDFGFFFIAKGCLHCKYTYRTYLRYLDDVGPNFTFHSNYSIRETFIFGK
jgi:hypothetical protein